MLFKDLFPGPWPLIGVVHLPPLPGYPRTPGIKALVAHALQDLEALEAAGFDGILIENENDQPHSILAPAEAIAAMTEITGRVVERARRVVVGAELLLNDPKASLAVAMAASARFIRTDYFVDRMARDDYGGDMAIDPDGLIAYRRKIGAEEVAIFADIQVKYARMLEPRPIAVSARLARDKGADSVIVTGALTGSAPDTGDLRDATAALASFPVLIGSGLSAENAAILRGVAQGAIVGTGIMSGGKIDRTKARALRALLS